MAPEDRSERTEMSLGDSPRLGPKTDVEVRRNVVKIVDVTAHQRLLKYEYIGVSGEALC
jgi:hypothetical protein